MDNPILGYIINKQVNTPSGIALDITHMKHVKEEDGMVLFLACPDAYKEGVYSELGDMNLANVFTNRVLQLLISAGLPVESIRKIYCDEAWIQLSPV